MRERLNDFWADLLGLVPEILLFLVILVVGFVVAALLAKATDALLNKLRVNRLFNRNVEKATSQRLGWNIVGVLSRVVYWLIVLFTLYFAFGVFGPNPFEDLFRSIIAFLPKIVVALFLIVIAVAVAGIVRELVERSLAGFGYGRTLANISGAFILGFGILAALAQIGVAVAVLLPLLYFLLITVAGVIIVGVGGALIAPMRPRVERYLSRAEREMYPEPVNPDLEPNALTNPIKDPTPLRETRNDDSL